MRNGSSQEAMHPQWSLGGTQDRQWTSPDTAQNQFLDDGTANSPSGIESNNTFGYKNHASRLVTFSDSPTPKQHRQWGPKRPAHSAIHSRRRHYISIPPDQDFGLLPAEKQINMVWLGYGNINGFPGKQCW